MHNANFQQGKYLVAYVFNSDLLIWKVRTTLKSILLYQDYRIHYLDCGNCLCLHHRYGDGRLNCNVEVLRYLVVVYMMLNLKKKQID